MNVVLNAIDEAGAKDREAILEAIAATKDYEGALGTWSFDENGDTTLTEIGAYKIEGDAYVFQKYISAPGGDMTGQATPGASGGSIKLVSSLPRTGLSKTQTDDVVAGYKMALEEHDNKAGGFDIVYEDSGRCHSPGRPVGRRYRAG